MNMSCWTILGIEVSLTSHVFAKELFIIAQLLDWVVSYPGEAVVHGLEEKLQHECCICCPGCWVKCLVYCPLQSSCRSCISRSRCWITLCPVISFSSPGMCFLLWRHDLQRGDPNQSHKRSVCRAARAEDVGRQPADGQHCSAHGSRGSRTVVMQHPPIAPLAFVGPWKLWGAQHAQGETTKTSRLHKMWEDGGKMHHAVLGF